MPFFTNLARIPQLLDRVACLGLERFDSPQAFTVATVVSIVDGYERIEHGREWTRAYNPRAKFLSRLRYRLKRAEISQEVYETMASVDFWDWVRLHPVAMHSPFYSAWSSYIDDREEQQKENELTNCHVSTLESGPSAFANQQQLSELAAATDDILKTLTPREEKVLRQRFGVDCEAKSLRKIAIEQNVSAQWIRQIEANSLRKLRAKHRAIKLAKFVRPSLLGRLASHHMGGTTTLTTLDGALSVHTLVPAGRPQAVTRKQYVPLATMPSVDGLR